MFFKLKVNKAVFLSKDTTAIFEKNNRICVNTYTALQQYFFGKFSYWTNSSG